ncbi:MAG TPA: DUF1385 domain-containing protein [Clostridiaceae bacterium]|nr:DUF1385 domain-containing protein [Clostridiaceae bacterium]
MKKTTIGGQALIEGLLMIGPENAAIAIRKPDGEILVEKRPLPAKGKLSKIPVIRGVVNMFRQLVLGLNALMYSAEFVEIEEEEKDKKSKFDVFIEKIFGKKGKDALIYITVIISLAFSIGLFILLPNLLASLLNFNKDSAGGVVLYNLFEGVIRLLIFFGYIVLASTMKDIKRIWEYHGAEHKTIHCYEHEDELTVENVRKYSTKHPRCGTSFMFLVMIISIFVFSFLGWHSVWVNILSRILLIPVVAGLSYELLKLAGRSNLKIFGIVNAPGKLFQYFTTKEPDDSQIEVAIAAFNEVRVPDKDADRW